MKPLLLLGTCLLAAPVAASAAAKTATAPPVYEEDFEDANVQATGGFIRFGENIHVQEGEQVDGPVIAVGGSAKVEGAVNGPVISIGGTTELGPRSEINGPALSLGGRTLRAVGSRVEGPIIDTPGARFFAVAAATLAYLTAASAGLALLAKLSAGIGWIVLSLVLLAAFPSALRSTRDAIETRPADCALVGLLAWPCVFVIATTLAISLIGLPLLPPLLALTAAAYAWGFAALGWWTGMRLAKDRWDSPAATMLLGMAVLKAVQFLPLAKWLIIGVVGVLGVGAAVVSRFGTRSPKRPLAG